MTKFHLIQLEFTLQYITLTNYYYQFRGHIQMMSNDSTINMETKSNRMKKMTKLHPIQLEITLKYITLTNYYIAKDIFR